MSVEILREPVGQYSIGLLTPDRESAGFWEAAHAGRLVLQACRACGHRQFPPLPRCRSCKSDSLGWDDAPRTGSLYSWIVVRHPLVERQRGLTPFSVGVVEVEPGVRIVVLLDVSSDRLVGDMTIDLRVEPTDEGAVILGRASDARETIHEAEKLAAV
jgi:uncharacterized OB-fold protein